MPQGWNLNWKCLNTTSWGGRRAYIEIEPFFLSKCDLWREDACLNIFCSLTPWKTGRYHLTEDKIELSDFSLHISIIQVTTWIAALKKEKDIEHWWDGSAACNGAESRDIAIVPEAPPQITPTWDQILFRRFLAKEICCKIVKVLLVLNMLS